MFEPFTTIEHNILPWGSLPTYLAHLVLATVSSLLMMRIGLSTRLSSLHRL